MHADEHAMTFFQKLTIKSSSKLCECCPLRPFANRQGVVRAVSKTCSHIRCFWLCQVRKPLTVALASHHISGTSFAQWAILGLHQWQPDGVYIVEICIKELWIALGQWQQCLFSQQGGLAIKLLPHMIQSKVGVARQRFHLLHWSLQLRKSAVPFEDMSDFLGRGRHWTPPEPVTSINLNQILEPTWLSIADWNLDTWASKWCHFNLHDGKMVMFSSWLKFLQNLGLGLVCLGLGLSLQQCDHSNVVPMFLLIHFATNTS